MSRNRSLLPDLAVALLTVLCASAAAGALYNEIGPRVYPLFILAVLIAAWYGGRRPGSAAALLSLLALTFFFTEPRHSLHVSQAADLVALGLFGAVSVGTIAIAEALRASRRQAEASIEALRRSERLYRAIGESIDYGIWVCDPTGRNTYASESFLRLVGLTQEQCSEFGWGDVLHPDDAASTIAAWKECARTGASWEREHRFRGVDGEWHPILARGLPIRDDSGQIECWAGINLDISALKAAEELQRALSDRLEEQRAFLETVLQQMPAGVIIAEAPSGRPLLVNEETRRITRYEFAEAPPFRDADQHVTFKGLHPDGRQYADHEWPLARAIGRGETVVDETITIEHADGSHIVISASAAPVRDRQGKIVAGIVTFTDISERRRLEEALNQRVAELAEADRQKDDFLAMLAHELRNPLAPIRTATALLKEIGPKEPRLARARETIDRQVKQQASLVDDLLDVSRISRGKIRLRKEPLNLLPLIRDAAEDCRLELDQAGVALTVHLPDHAVWVDGDPTRLAQVVGNLLHNSAKFTERGGQVRVEVTVDADRSQVRIAVKDTGIGIEPEVLPRVFETFTQADRSLERTRGGLGLGLALVKGLVELHDGTVEAASEGVGRGAEFTLQLPTIPAPARPVTEPRSDTPAGPIRVLIIEDNRDAADSLRELLEIYGCTVAVAYTGSEGVEAARRFRPEVVFCDLGLPGMSGYEVATTLRREASTAGARLIALSGYGQEEDLRRSREAGFDLHLTKPAEIAELRRLLEVTPDERRV
jgi:PAS domain S-box-containing protein